MQALVENGRLERTPNQTEELALCRKDRNEVVNESKARVNKPVGSSIQLDVELKENDLAETEKVPFDANDEDEYERNLCKDKDVHQGSVQDTVSTKSNQVS